MVNRRKRKKKKLEFSAEMAATEDPIVTPVEQEVASAPAKEEATAEDKPGAEDAGGKAKKKDTKAKKASSASKRTRKRLTHPPYFEV